MESPSLISSSLFGIIGRVSVVSVGWLCRIEGGLNLG